MERLTARNEQRQAYLANVKGNEQEVEGSRNTLQCLYDSWQRLAVYEDLGTVEELATALDYQKRIVQCNDCRYYHYSEEAGGSVCCNNESDWVADFPPSDCSCQHCERREG